MPSLPPPWNLRPRPHIICCFPLCKNIFNFSVSNYEIPIFQILFCLWIHIFNFDRKLDTTHNRINAFIRHCTFLSPHSRLSVDILLFLHSNLIKASRCRTRFKNKRKGKRNRPKRALHQTFLITSLR